VYAEVLEEEHGTPVVEGWLFKPGVSVEIGRDTGAKAVTEGVRVCTDQTEAISAEDGGEAVEQKEEYEGENDGYFEGSGPRGQASARGTVHIR
jgi:hypothetical protein